MIEASSGSTAVSEAYFARMLGLRFIAVVPASTAPPKLDAIRFYGGEIHEVADPRAVYDVAQRARGRDGRPLSRPVHLCRARHRLARQQQYRRKHVRADAQRGASDSRLGRLRRRHRRHLRHDRPLHPLPALRHPACASPTRSTRSSTAFRRSGPALLSPGVARRSKGSAGRGSSQASCPTSSTA